MDAVAVGHRAMASNLSDIASMGARPVLATIALGLTAEIGETWIVECYRAMNDLASAHGAQIAGGDITRSPAILLSITIVGEVSRSRLKRRDGGRPGDILAVTGALGASRAGLEVLRGDVALDQAMRLAALRAFATPQPRIGEGRWLGASAHVHAMMDCSDGLALDVSRLARASGCGATLEEIPIAPEAAAVAAATGGDARTYALEGGEDFELIAAVAPRAFAHLARRFKAHFRRPLRAVGRLDVEPGLRLREGPDLVRDVVPAGWDHLGTLGS